MQANRGPTTTARPVPGVSGIQIHSRGTPAPRRRIVARPRPNSTPRPIVANNRVTPRPRPVTAPSRPVIDTGFGGRVPATLPESTPRPTIDTGFERPSARPQTLGVDSRGQIVARYHTSISFCLLERLALCRNRAMCLCFLFICGTYRGGGRD